jgi:ribosomal-protein-alanine N-acetyltransferase
MALPVIETPRLRLHRLTADDADFILELLNEPTFLRYIGDKGVRTREDACRYLRTGQMASYDRLGFGLYRVERRDSGEPIGICGLLKRESLEAVDVGFAFLPRSWSNGFAAESAAAVLAHERRTWGLKRVLAVTSPDNEASIRLLGKLGFRFERMARLSEEAPEVKVFASEVRATPFPLPSPAG